MDPVDINVGYPDEYEPEVRTILPRLPDCNSLSEVRQVVEEEFGRWFGPGETSPQTLDQVAQAVWAAWSARGGE